MLPAFASNNTPSMGVTDIESQTNLGRRDTLRCKCADSMYVGRLEFGHAMRLAIVGDVFVSSLLHHILDVIGICSLEQMVGVATRATITSMERVHPVTQRAKMKFIGDAVGAKQWARAAAKFSIARIVDVSLPFPALVEWARSYMLPKHFFLRAGWAMPFAEAHVLPLDQSPIAIVSFGNRRNLAAAAFTVLGFSDYGIAQPVMSATKTNWFANGPSAVFSGIGCNLGLLPTAAMAVAVRNFIRGIIEGHQKLPFWCLIWERCRDAAQYFYWLYSCNCITIAAA